MTGRKMDAGFTIVEVIVTLVVISLFLTLFFQLFLVSQSQRVAVLQRAAANDIAQNNLRKISKKTQIPAAGACDPSTAGASNKNNYLRNPTLDPSAGSIIVAEDDGDINTPQWGVGAGIPTKESIAGTGLPIATTKQTLLVSYPRGCTTLMPAKIISIVTYGAGESVVRAGYAN